MEELTENGKIENLLQIMSVDTNNPGTTTNGVYMSTKTDLKLECERQLLKIIENW